MLFNFIPLAAATALFSAVFVQAGDLAPGRYRIVNGAQSARSYPLPRGSFEASITMSDQHAGTWEQWDIKDDGNDGYIIQNVGTGAKAYAPQVLDTPVVAASNKQTSWFIEDRSINPDEKLYIVKIPFQDFLWTNTPRSSADNTITLKGSDGSAVQRWVFEHV